MTGKDTEQCAAKGGCEPVVKRIEGLETVTYDTEKGITALNSKKVSWSAMGGIASIFALSVICLILWFGSIKSQAEDYPKVKEKLEAKAIDNADRITRLETTVAKFNDLASKLDDSASKLDAAIVKLDNKIASKELKEYNIPKTN